MVVRGARWRRPPRERKVEQRLRLLPLGVLRLPMVVLMVTTMLAGWSGSPCLGRAGATPWRVHSRRSTAARSCRRAVMGGQ